MSSSTPVNGQPGACIGRLRRRSPCPLCGRTPMSDEETPTLDDERLGKLVVEGLKAASGRVFP
jgi:hypothetical protein